MAFQNLLFFLLRVLCAEILVFEVVYISYTCAGHLLKKCTMPLRWCAGIILGMWLVTFIFHLLIYLKLFSPIPALITFSALTGLLIAADNPLKLFFSSISKDFKRLKRAYRFNGRSPHRLFFYTFFLFLFITLLRTGILPLLGWDSLTYHAVKAGMWVKSKGPITMNAPGGWAYYRSFLGGGEIFTSWVMLPFHSDLLAGTVDAVIWFCLGFALYTLGSVIKIPARFRWVAAAYVLFLPALWFSIGSGYVEPCLNLALILGTIFAIRFLRHQDGPSLLLSLTAFGMAAGIKHTALPIVFAALLVVLLYVLSIYKNHRILGCWALTGILAAVFVVIPWFVRNMQQTGYPLSPLAVSVAGIKLGQSPQSLEWYQQRENLSPYSLLVELKALSRMFYIPTKSNPHLSIISALPLFLCAFVLMRMVFHHRKEEGILIIAIIGATLFSFYHPNFSVVRIMWAHTTARFLLPILCPAVVLSCGWCKNSSFIANLYYRFLIYGTFIHIVLHAFFGYAPFEFLAIGLGMAAIILLFIFVTLLMKRYAQSSVILGAVILGPLLILPLLNGYRNNIRYEALAKSVVLHPVFSYWKSAPELLDSKEKSWKVAVTSGPLQNGDNWFTYFFLGQRLQNDLFYIPITEDGSIIDFGPNTLRKSKGNFESWLARLREKGITHVISFNPRGIELSWMEERPELFELLKGDGTSWGLYRIR